MIVIKNTQRSIRINQTQIRQQVQAMLARAGYPTFGIGIWFTTNATIRRLNKKFRHKDKATDILSFPFYPELKPNASITATTEDERYLGDIVISLAYAKKDAQENWHRPFDQHLVALLAHGIAHLLGHDHQTDRQTAIMNICEKNLLAATSQK